ncbi:MAG: co-chaperone DjlA [Gammaproteobacteria bacterium]|nr:co-chaperone DjlA [Gammaproteobacteria bacterium]
MNGYLLGKNMASHRTGMVVGALIGLATGGGFGLLFGAIIGYQADKFVRRLAGGEQWTQATAQGAFFDASFAVMGKVAKADGRVTQVEIQYAETVMARMQLKDDKRQRAIAFFNKGKQNGYEMADVLEPLRRALGRSNAHARMMFVEIQLAAALVDGHFSSDEGRVLGEMCQLLGVTQREFEAVTARMAAQHSFQQQHGNTSQPHANEIAHAYGVLGVAPECDNKTLKQAYRRLMSQHHPDKLVAQGLPDEMMQLAKEKTQEIQAAYDVVKRARK